MLGKPFITLTEQIDKGFQIFNTYRVGYHIKLFKDKFFFEPSLAVTHRPYHTRMPDFFKQKDKIIGLNSFLENQGCILGITFKTPSQIKWIKQPIMGSES